MLELEQLEVVYHRVVTAVQGVSLSVHAGQIVALLGNNGAGKTTTLRAVSGFLGIDDARVSGGSIRLRGRDVANLPPYRLTALGVALVPERDKVFPNLTVAENLEVVRARPKPASSALTGRRADRDLAYEYFPALAGLRRREAGYLSGGERQMLAIGAALACAPELLLVDELSLGLAPRVAADLAARLARIRDEQGVTILLVEQNAEAALAVSDYAYVMENGRIVLHGPPERLRGHADVREFYLGGESGRRSYRDVKQYRRNRRWYG